MDQRRKKDVERKSSGKVVINLIKTFDAQCDDRNRWRRTIGAYDGNECQKKWVSSVSACWINNSHCPTAQVADWHIVCLLMTMSLHWKKWRGFRSDVITYELRMSA